METKQSTLANFNSEISKKSSISTKRIWDRFDFGARYAKIFIKSLESGTFPLLPGPDGILNINGAYDMRTNNLHHGISQLMLKIRQAMLNSDSCAFISDETLQKARTHNIDCYVIKGEIGFDIAIPKASDLEVKRWFCESQLTKPENLKIFLAAEQQRNASEKQKWYDKTSPSKTAIDASLKNPNRENTGILECTAKTPEEYLGQVFVAMSTGNALKISKEISDMFIEKTIAYLKQEHKPGTINKLAIYKLASMANNYCKNYLYEKNKQEQKKLRKQKIIVKRKPSYERSI